MFSYYGGKRSLIRYYPPPKYDKIVEPFAGSAAYSLRYYLRDVTLIEINPVVYGIWHWFLKQATLKDIEALPELKQGESLKDYKQLTQVERDLLGFCASAGNARPTFVISQYSFGYRGRERDKIFLLKRRMKWLLPRLKHWKVLNLSYLQYKVNGVATWFIDSPYNCKAGKAYPFSDIDYTQLAAWCKLRQGQVIVCENRTATWLPFRPLPGVGKARGIAHKPLTEGVWIKDA